MKNTKRSVAAARKAKQLPEWLDRGLLTLPFCYTLCTTKLMFEMEQERLGVLPEHYSTFAKLGGANFIFYEKKEFADPTCLPAGIITINDDPLDPMDPIQVAALLTHEAVHAVQQCMLMIGEHKPSDELQAYATQRVAQQLMYEYVRQRYE